MIDRFVMRFAGKMTTFAEDELNKFLDEHPDYDCFLLGTL